MMFGDEKYSYDRDSQRVFVDNYEKGTRAVFWLEDGNFIQKTKTGCSAEGLILLYKTVICG